MESAASCEPISPANKPTPPPSPASFIANIAPVDPAPTHLLVHNIDSRSDSHEIVLSVRRPFMRESPSRRRLHSSLPSLSQQSLTCIVRGRFRLLAGSRLWIIMRFLATLSQIMAVLVVLAVSREERAQKPLPAWVMGYALGCIAMLPLFYRWFKAPHSYINGISEEQEYMLYHHVNAISIISQLQGDDNLTLDRGHTQEGNDRIELFMDRLRICLDFFFAIWFVLGNVWVLGTPSIAQASPKLYSLCVALLVLSCLRYAMSLVFCFAVCCCPRPWLVGSRSNGTNEQPGEREGATQELIDATLPIYKFKSKRPIIHHYPLCSSKENETNPQHKAMSNNNMFECLAETHDISRTGGGGVMALPTCHDEKMISVDDSACCICLRRYKDNVELRGLPCSHYFHVECVDQWLKINASCPLCKSSLQKRKLVVYPFLWRWMV